jgi:diguanylate cyclase (GGDEF)-like protein
MAVASIAVLIALGVPAHAITVEAPLPQTPVQLPQAPPVTVTAPGAEVTLGPGGATVNVDPGKAVGGVVGGQPQGGPSPGSSTGPSQGMPSASGADGGGGGSTPSRGDSSAPVASAPARPRKGSRSRRGGVRAARSGSSSSPSGATARSGTPAEVGTRGVAATRPATAGTRSQPGVVTRIVETIPQELLVALLLMALFGVAMSVVWLRERRRVRVAQRKAEVDALTGISNRLGFEQQLSGEWKRARRYARPLGVLLLDLDGLKRVNDTDGHEAGDRLIQAAAGQISQDIRQSDLAARLAGDEFVVLCPETDRHGLEQLGAKLSERLGDAGIAASVGWAELADRDVEPADLLARADAAMYQEKARRRQGRPASTARPGFAIAG